MQEEFQNKKGVEELILSFLEADTHSLKLKIVGDGPTLDSLKEKYKNPKIDFLGLRKILKLSS